LSLRVVFFFSVAMAPILRSRRNYTPFAPPYKLPGSESGSVFRSSLLPGAIVVPDVAFGEPGQDDEPVWPENCTSVRSCGLVRIIEGCQDSIRLIDFRTNTEICNWSKFGRDNPTRRHYRTNTGGGIFARQPASPQSRACYGSATKCGSYDSDVSGRNWFSESATKPAWLRPASARDEPFSMLYCLTFAYRVALVIPNSAAA